VLELTEMIFKEQKLCYITKLLNEKQNLIISNTLPQTPEGIWELNCKSPQEITACKCYLKKEVHNIKAEVSLK
jgi:hypothetical protein